MRPHLSISRRTRRTPFSSRVEAAGASGYTVYNHTLLATSFRGIEVDYWHLCENVQVWDVSCEKQVTLKGPDASRLAQYMTPRNLTDAQVGRCYYLPMCDENGAMMNDAVAIKVNDGHWRLSVADSDILLWAKGLAVGFDLDVEVREPDMYPLAVQGPKAVELMIRVFGEGIKELGFFAIAPFMYNGQRMKVARSGWSKQTGYEVFVNNPEIGTQLWDELFTKGQDLDVRAGCPNLIERIESGLLSFGNDMGHETTPFEIGLDKYVDLDADIDSLSLPALRKHTPTKQLMGLVLEYHRNLSNLDVFVGEKKVGDIRSQAYSPKYMRRLAFVMCDLAALDGATSVEVITDQGKATGHLTSLPFDFDALGLSACR
ncbi:MAG TPA: dimethylsulfoniopropionate demethylase [Oceanospirillaceae bacterium]|nr:dimethylsulfoniopropionate demethylase [Oceanospirillaceae bacterium]